MLVLSPLVSLSPSSSAWAQVAAAAAHAEQCAHDVKKALRMLQVLL